MRIHIIACMFLFISCVACQQTPSALQPVTAGIDFTNVNNSPRDSGKIPSAAANIIFQSVDGGQNWQNVSAGLPKNLGVECVYTDGEQVYVGTMNGLYRSYGTSTAPEWEKMLFLEGRIVHVTPGKMGLYACSYGLGVFQNMPGTDIWKPVSHSLKDKTIRTIRENADGSILVGSDTGIYKSTDAGQSWKQVFEGGIVLNIVASGDVLIGGSANGVLRSTDIGEHWEYALNENILAKKTGLLQDHFVTILGTKNPTFASTLNIKDSVKVSPQDVTNRLRTSDDGGKTWHRMERALLPIQGAFAMDERLSQAKDLYDIVQVGNYLICTFDTGIYRSSDQGKTWEPVLPSTKERMMANMSVSGNVIYVIAGGGC